MEGEVAAAAAALIGAMINQGAWPAARTGIINLWKRFKPAQVEAMERELDLSQEDLTAGDEASRLGLMPMLEGRWQARLQMLAEESPQVIEELVALIDRLQGAPESRAQTPTVQNIMSGRDAYTAGRDQTINRGARDGRSRDA